MARANGAYNNVTAYIKSISIFGDMVVEFNASMNTNFSFSEVNMSLVDIYIIPSDREDDFDIKKVNFTWELIKVTNSQHHYKLIWDYPLEISPNTE